MKDWMLRLFRMDRHHGTVPEEWQRIARVNVAHASGRNEIKLEQACDFTMLKLRSLFIDMRLNRWTVEFEDGASQNLPVGWLIEGTECRPMQVTGRRLKGMTVEYVTDARARAGRLDVFACR